MAETTATREPQPGDHYGVTYRLPAPSDDEIRASVERGELPQNLASFKRTHCDACSTAARDARQQSKLAQGQRDSWKQSDRGCRYVPTPEQIAQAAAAIREKWSEAEMRTRLGMNREVLPLETQVVTSRIYAE